MGRPGLSRDVVVQAAVRIADEEGMDAVTMRRVAQSLGVTPMALYRYLPDKSTLIDVVVDESLRVVPLVRPTGPVEAELLRCFGGLYELLLAHPGLARAAAERPLEGEVATEIGERIVTLLQRNGISADSAGHLLVAAFSLTLGSALYRSSRTGRTDRSLSRVRAETAAVHGIRDVLIAAGAGDAVFRDSLTRLLRSYLGPSKKRTGTQSRGTPGKKPSS